MNLKTLNLKLVLGTIYLLIIAVALYFLFTFVDLRDLGSYEFIRSNKDLILKFKNENFLLLAFSFFTFSVIWTLLLGFATPILLFAGFVFGKWWGILLVLVATTIGATLLYLLATLFFKDFIENNGRDANLSDSPEKAIISLVNSRGTSYEMYIAVQNELTAAYNELRNEAAILKYNLNYTELGKDKKREIRKMYPMKISEAPPGEF